MQVITLTGAVLLASTISGLVGMGGGVFLLAVMASLLDPLAVVPVHGVIQLVSNGTRVLRLLRNVNWRIFGLYTPMLGLGAWAGIGLYSGAGASWFRPAIGGFVLAFLIWDRVKPKRMQVPQWVLVPAGFGGGLLTVLVGATGPYLAAFFLRDDLERREVVSTKAAIQVVGHLVKIPAFLSVGFSYREEVGLILPLTVAAVAGTFLGTAMLGRVPEHHFRVGFRIVLALLALRLLLGGIITR